MSEESDLLNQVVPLLLDKKSQVNPKIDPTAFGNSQDFIKSLFGQSTDNSQYQALIDSILQRSAINFAPVLGDQINSGGYNSTVVKQLQDEARARATSEAAGAVINAKAQAGATGAKLAGEQLHTTAGQETINRAQVSAGKVISALIAHKLILKGVDKGLEGFPGSLVGTQPAAPIEGAQFTSARGADSFGSGSVDTVGYQGAGVPGQLTSDEFSNILNSGAAGAASNTAFFPSITDSSVSSAATETAIQPSQGINLFSSNNDVSLAKKSGGASDEFGSTDSTGNYVSAGSSSGGAVDTYNSYAADETSSNAFGSSSGGSTGAAGAAGSAYGLYESQNAPNSTERNANAGATIGNYLYPGIGYGVGYLAGSAVGDFNSGIDGGAQSIGDFFSNPFDGIF